MHAILGDMIVGFLKGIFIGFFKGVVLGITFSIITFSTFLSLVINPITIMVCTLFYRRNLSYKEKYLVISYSIFKYYIQIYVVNILSIVFLYVLKSNMYINYYGMDLVPSILTINSIFFIISILIYKSANKTINEKKIKINKEIFKRNKTNIKWEIKYKEIIERFKILKNIEALNHEIEQIINLNNKINKVIDIGEIIDIEETIEVTNLNDFQLYKEENPIRLVSKDMQQTFMSIFLIYGKYEEDWSVIAIRIVEDMLFIKIELKDKKQKLFTFKKVI